MEVKKVKIFIDDKAYDVLPGRNLLHVCLALGFDIPHFCFHPALGSVGACRLCAVRKYRDSNDTRGRIVMSCMEPVTEGLIVTLEDEGIRDFRKAVIESLMINHPHDCPVCDEGGECHLQDMTMMTGHNYRKYRFLKRTYRNQYMGPFISHEMNRCIQCYRCVRYYRDYAGGKDLNAFGAHDRLYFGRANEGILENEFSGNLAEVCPTGVFTDKTLGKHYTRKWDLTNAPSICVHCSAGCNTIVGERYGQVRRILSRYNGSVNGHFICDRGRFGYEFVNDDDRIKNIYIRQDRSSDFSVANEESFKSAAELLLTGRRVIGIGSPRASLESNFSLSQFVGVHNFYSGISGKDKMLVNKALKYLSGTLIHSPSLREIEQADAILILGEDLTNCAPMVALAVRQAMRNESFKMAEEKKIPLWQDDAVRTNGNKIKSPVILITAVPDKLDEIALGSFRAAPQDIARLGLGIAASIKGGVINESSFSDSENEIIEKAAKELTRAVNPLIISGVHLRNEEIIDAAATVAQTVSGTGKKCSLSFLFPECNSAGVEMLVNRSLDDAFEAVRNGDVDTAIILENDIYRRAEKSQADSFFDQCRQIIVLDHLRNETTNKADIIIPAGTFAETTGTFVNNEGRAQRFYSSMPYRYPIMDSWKWIDYLEGITQKGDQEKLVDFRSVVMSMIEIYPFLKGLQRLSDEKGVTLLNEKIARQTPRFSGRTAMRANINVSEAAVPKDIDSPLSYSMEGRREFPPSGLVPYYWYPGWNSVQAIYKYTEEPNGSLKGGDPGIRVLDDRETDYMVPEQNVTAFVSDSERILIVPLYQIFGSEELSSRGEAVSERIPETFILMNHEDAENLNNGSAMLKISQYLFPVEIKTDRNIPKGIGGLFIRQNDVPFLDLPALGEFQKMNKHE